MNALWRFRPRRLPEPPWMPWAMFFTAIAACVLVISSLSYFVIGATNAGVIAAAISVSLSVALAVGGALTKPVKR